MKKFYKKRGKAIWRRKFISQRKNGQSANVRSADAFADVRNGGYC